MKIAVINFSGNTGKTTLAKHLLIPQLPGATRAEIEDVNFGDGKADLELAASKFKALAAELNIAGDDEHFVIDIGASNAKAMVEHFAQLKSTRAGIDFWVIPVVPTNKQRLDSMNTADTLMGIGVEPSKIVMILNNITDTDAVNEEFSTIFQSRKHGINVVSEVVLASEIFELLKNKDASVFDIAAAAPDFKVLMKAARDKGDKKGLEKLGQQQVLQDLAEASVDNLRAVFNATPLAAKLAELTAA